MTCVIKSYRFDLPSPAFTESNYDKGHWPIIHTLEADLAEYPNLHEVLGIEMIISDRIYDGENITFEAKYFNKDTGEHIFTSNQFVPDPSTEGYTYWNSYRICSWIGHCHWEIDGPMNIRIIVTVKKGVVPIGLEDITMVVTETIVQPPPPGPCPDFWEDPIGWTLCTITNGFSIFAEWFGSSFWGFIISVTDWLNTFGSSLGAFIRDPATKIQDWMQGTWTTITEVTNSISTGIANWWTQEIINVGIMISNATEGFSDWIDDRFTGINDWWADAQTVWGTFWDERIKGVEDWINEFSTNVSNWYNSNIQPTIDAISSGIDDAADWIKDFPTLLSTWWNDRIIEVGVWIADGTAAANDWITGFPTLIGNWWNDRVIEIGVWLTDRNNEIKKWVDDGLPGWVEVMFEWAKPLVSPIIAVAEVLGKLLDITEETIERTPEEQAHLDNSEAINERIREIVEGR